MIDRCLLTLLLLGYRHIAIKLRKANTPKRKMYTSFSAITLYLESCLLIRRDSFFIIDANIVNHHGYFLIEVYRNGSVKQEYLKRKGILQSNLFYSPNCVALLNRGKYNHKDSKHALLCQ